MGEQPFASQDAVSIEEDEAARGRDTRASTLLMATIRVEGEGGAGYPLRVRNLSAGGLMADCERRLGKGERIEVELRNIGAIAGTVAWVSGGRIGVQFDRAIDPIATRRPVTGAATQTSTIIVAASGRRPGLR